MNVSTADKPVARPSRPPRPKGTFLFGNLSEFTADRLGTLMRWAREYGDIVSIRFGPRQCYFVNHPELVEQVLVHQNRKFIKHFRLRQAKGTMGEGLLTSEGDFWRSQRKLVQPAFHRDKIAAFGQVMVDYAVRLRESFQDGQIRDLQEDMMRLTLEIVGKTLFNADVQGESARISETMETLMQIFEASSSRPVVIPRWVPIPSNFRVARAIRGLDDIIYTIIAERRRTGDNPGDLLSMLLSAQDEDSGRHMTDRQLRDECMTLFLAGHETTASTLAWTWLLLSQNPQVEAKLHAELDTVLAGRVPSLADMPKLPYTENIIHEALRLYPPGWMVGREAIERTELGGYPVPKGTTIFMTSYAIHRDARWFDDPESFEPDRWVGGLVQRIPRYAYFPFGGGPRICIGNNFALMEAILVLATIAQKYRLRLAPGATVTPLPSMTLRPAHGVSMVVSSR
jgi:cytochrome P450